MAKESQEGSSGQKKFLGLYHFLSFRRNQVASMDTIEPSPSSSWEQQQQQQQQHDNELFSCALDQFQSHVDCHLRSLLPSDSDSDSDSTAPILSLPFLSKLLDALVSCDREFYHLLLRSPSSSSSSLLLSKPAAEFLDRSVKALDFCNAASAALLSLRHWRRQADIAADALALRRTPLPLSRSRRALAKLFAPDLRASGSGSGSGSARFLPKNWSAGVGGCVGGGGGAGGRMAAAAYTMSCLLALAAWALAVAVPFLDRGAINAAAAGERPAVAPPRQLHWAAAMAALQDRIAEECSQRKRGFGLLAEARAVETHAKCLIELLDKPTPPPPAEDELLAKAAALAEACRALEEGTEPLERQLRAVFHRVAATRAEVARCLDRSSRCSAASAPSSSSSSSSPSPPS